MCFIAEMNPDEERDDLWELLGRAKTPTPTPFFARNVLREIRAGTQPRTPWNWLAVRWRAATLGAIALALLASIPVLHNGGSREKTVPAIELARQTANSADYEVIARLDELLAFEDSTIWPDTSIE